MKTLTKLLISLFLVFALHITLYTLHSYAAIPHLINYQGRLTDSSGVPLNGAYQLTFRIYDAETAGNLLWEETHTGVVIQKGIFSLLLGSVTNLDLPFDKSYWLEIKVGNEVMGPRQRITSSAYAIRAENADKLSGVEVKTTPTANSLLALDGNARFATGEGLLRNNIAVITGTISHGQTIPLPSGYTQDKCIWFLGAPYWGSLPFREDDNFVRGLDISVDSDRVVTARLLYSWDGGRTEWINISVHYIVIGVK